MNYFIWQVVKALDDCSLKVVGFFEPLKVRAAEAKSDFPTRHDWDEFFRSAEDMNELKAGERPDTIYLAKVPTNWFKVREKFIVCYHSFVPFLDAANL